MPGTLLGLAVLTSPAFALNAGLHQVHQRIESRLGSVSHLPADVLATRLAETRSEAVLFNVRKPAEFAVSHLPGAIQVDPDIDEQSFLKAFGSLVANKQVVMYCSVGWRSSTLADSVQRQLVETGAKSVQNLKGGIFHWHNEERPLHKDSRPTRAIHPYNAFWGWLIDDGASIRRNP